MTGRDLDLKDTFSARLPSRGKRAAMLGELAHGQGTVIEPVAVRAAPGPPPGYPPEVIMALAMLAGKEKVWAQRGQLATCDAYLGGRTPGEYNPLRKRRRYHQFHAAIAEAAAVLRNPHGGA